MISTGDTLPEATLIQMGENGPEEVRLSSKVKGRKVVIFAVPGAFTPTCHSAHVPSFMRTKDQFAAKGVDEIICVSVNDPFVMKAWGEATGATSALWRWASLRMVSSSSVESSIQPEPDQQSGRTVPRRTDMRMVLVAWIT